MASVIVTHDVEDVQKFLSKFSCPMICDIETTSLTVGKGKIICLALAPASSSSVLVWWIDDVKDLKQFKLSKAVFHNAYFDERWLRSYGAKVRTVWDTMLIAHLLNENASASLKNLGQRLFGYNDWSQESIDDLLSVPEDEVTEYVAMDVHVTRQLYKWQRQHIKSKLKPNENPVRVMRQVMLPAMRALWSMEDNKLPVRMNRVEKIMRQTQRRIDQIEQELDRQIPPPEELPEWLNTRVLKWGQTNFTRWWLYVYQGAPVIARGRPSKAFPEGAPSLAQDNLVKIDHPAAKLLAELGTLRKASSAFLVPLLEKSVDGRVSTGFRLTGTVTGRLSSASPAPDNPGINSQQIPRDKDIRNLFGERGKLWIECDYSQLELRVAARLANEHTMLGLFENNEDIHLYMAKQLVKSDEITKEQRSLAKGVNFGFLYGMHAKHFANYLQASYGVTISYDDAVRFRESYFQTFNRLPAWYKHQRSFALEHGGVYNAFGRFRHLPKVYNEDFWIQENAFRQAINAPVQSTGSDFMLISLGRLIRDRQLKEWGMQLITTVHDSVCMTAPPKYARSVAKRVKYIMEQADDALDIRFNLKVDATISRVWGGTSLAEY